MGCISVRSHIVEIRSSTISIPAFNFRDVKIPFGSANPDSYAGLFVADFSFSNYFPREYQGSHSLL